jgi:antitoxin component YwqK of YwqJK toxin-antitoxin module
MRHLIAASCLVLLGATALAQEGGGVQVQIGDTKEQVTHHANGRKKSAGLLKKNAKGAWVPDGIAHTWYPSGKKCALLSFKMGARHGIWKSYHENGQQASQMEFKDGRIVNTTTLWAEDGKLVETSVFSRDGEGNMTVKQTRYYKNGKKSEAGSWFRKKGSRKSVRDGLLTTYSDKGDVLKKERYKKGRLLGEKAPPAQAAREAGAAEKAVRAGIIRFRKEICSDDEKVRIAAFDRAFVDKKLSVKLFGKDGARVWPKMAEGVKMMRASTAQLKKELDVKGEVKAVKLVDVRKEGGAGRYRQVLTMIPKDIPVYRAVVESEKRTSGSSTYLLVDGKMRWFPGIEGIARSIARLKEAAVFEKLSRRFLAAMCSEKLKDAMACWLQVDEMLALIKNPPPGRRKPTAEKLATMKRYIETRDTVIKKWFPNLIKKLKEKKLAPKDLSYASSRGAVRKLGSFEKTSSVRMILKHKDGREVHIRIDDGFKYKGEWKFSDKPLGVSVVKAGKTEHVDVEPTR